MTLYYNAMSSNSEGLLTVETLHWYPISFPPFQGNGITAVKFYKNEMPKEL